jgi:hypothetical protein
MRSAGLLRVEDRGNEVALLVREGEVHGGMDDIVAAFEIDQAQTWARRSR